MQKYIISGIEPGKKGAGLFVQKFIELSKKVFPEIKIHYNRTPQNGVIRLLKRTFFYKKLRDLYLLFNNTVLPKTRISNSEIFLFHPQSLGLNNVQRLIKENNHIYFYVLDNFFFCIKSYNYIKTDSNSCLRCLSNNNKKEIEENNCKSYPFHYTIENYFEFINTIKENLQKITFLLQNENQKILLRNKFSENISTKVLGMYTKETELDKEESIVKNINKCYDFVYHNTLDYSKGIEYFLDLSSVLTDYSFLIPYDEKIVADYLGISIFGSNVKFNSCTWDTGLKEIIQNCKIAIHPSLWSAPVEGAFLKSIYYNGCVAVFNSSKSFFEEVPDDIVIKLDENITDSANKLLRYIDDNEKRNDLIKRSNNWLNNFQILTSNRIIEFLKLVR